MERHKQIPPDCPPLLLELIELAGGKSAAAREMGIHPADITKLFHGKGVKGGRPFTEFRQQQARGAIAKLKGEMTDMPMKAHISDKCPPIVKALIDQEGGVLQASRKAGVNKDGIRLIAIGKRTLSDVMKQKILAVLRPQPSSAPFGSPAAQSASPQRKEYPPWDGKTRAVKARAAGGKAITVKKVPAPMADLLDRHQGNRSQAGRAAGYTAAGPYVAVAEKISAYTPKMHGRFMAALAGEPPPSEAMANHALDKFITKLAVVILSLADYETIEEIAEIFNGELVTRMPLSGSLWLAIFRMSDRDKLEKFKRLARRDAKEIVCP